jgi:hypothetical protein
VGDVQKGEANLAVNALQLKLHALAHLQVKGPERLIEQQDSGLVHQGPSQSHPLLFTPAELMRIACLVAGELDDFQHLGHARLNITPREALHV